MNIQAFFAMSYGVYVVSSVDGERAVGCTANSAMQVTAEPETIAVSINHDNYTHGCIEKSGMFSLSIIGENSDPFIVGGFGFTSSRDTNKFDKVAHEFKHGMPVISDSCGFIVCKVISKMETPTHTVFLGAVVDADVLAQGAPMTYAYYHKVIKGKSPKNAPTYIDEKLLKNESEKKRMEETKKYVCTVCSYVYDGEIPFEELSDDYVCPICAVGKDLFEEE